MFRCRRIKSHQAQHDHKKTISKPLPGITFNFLMSLSGGLMADYVVSKGDPFWTYSSGLAGVIAASAGNDLYYPIQAMFIAAITVPVIYKMHYWVERCFKIDDVVGAVAVHGSAGDQDYRSRYRLHAGRQGGRADDNRCRTRISP